MRLIGSSMKIEEFLSEKKRALTGLSFQMTMNQSFVTYKNLLYLALETGWYFYITGIRLSSSKVVSFSNNINRRFTLKDIAENWNINTNSEIQLIPISLHKNAISFLLKTERLNLLLDAGYNEKRRGPNYVDILKEHVDSIDGIFLSHSHFDHCSGVANILEAFSDSIVLASSTTLDFYLFRNAEKKWTDAGLNLELPDQHRSIIANSVSIHSGSCIRFPSGQLNFYYAGHMPGALMVCISTNGLKFLYSGDFCYNDYPPIPGVESSKAFLPGRVDFAILDAASGKQSYPSRKIAFKELLNEVRKRVDSGHQVLIGADNASIAIVIYLALFKHFRDLQLKKSYRWRPRIVMGRNTLEYTKILQERSEDIHPNMQHGIETELTPFTSALTKYYTNARDIFSWIKRKRVIFIFGPPDFSSGLIRNLVRQIGKSPKNLIYLAGAIRSPEGIELISGNNEITLGDKIFVNKAEVFNVKFPDVALNLHADSHQIMEFVDLIRPNHVCLFHTVPKVMIPIRAKLSNLDYVGHTTALEENMEPLKLR
jgi:Cft2 family RNA processing exonuclease